MRISPASPSTDWQAVHALLVAAFSDMEGRIDPPSSLTRLVPADLASREALLAEDLGLVGCLFLEARADCLYLSKLAVAPAHQGNGIARALVEEASRIARTRGLTRLELQTRIELAENHRTFAQLGFARTGETAHPGFDRPTSITMGRAL
ncbi:MAG: GNAT family N-acetyltransferase [Pseudomonadota bacterium]